jgi:hypothetical protein
LCHAPQHQATKKIAYQPLYAAQQTHHGYRNWHCLTSKCM